MKSKKPILIGVILALLIVAAVFVLVRPKGIEQEMTYYELRFPAVFQKNEPAEENSGYAPEMPKIEKQAEHYQAESSRFVAQIPAKTYEEPFVYERKGETVLRRRLSRY